MERGERHHAIRARLRQTTWTQLARQRPSYDGVQAGVDCRRTNELRLATADAGEKRALAVILSGGVFLAARWGRNARANGGAAGSDGSPSSSASVSSTASDTTGSFDEHASESSSSEPQRPPLDRGCRDCDRGVQDTADHLWWECPAYDEIRGRPCFAELLRADRARWPPCTRVHGVIVEGMRVEVAALHRLMAAVYTARVEAERRRLSAVQPMHPWHAAAPLPAVQHVFNFDRLPDEPPRWPYGGRAMRALKGWLSALRWTNAGEVSCVELAVDFEVHTGVDVPAPPGIRRLAANQRGKTLWTMLSTLCRLCQDLQLPSPLPAERKVRVGSMRTLGAPMLWGGLTPRPRFAGGEETHGVLETSFPRAAAGDGKNWGGDVFPQYDAARRAQRSLRWDVPTPLPQRPRLPVLVPAAQADPLLRTQSVCDACAKQKCAELAMVVAKRLIVEVEPEAEVDPSTNNTTNNNNTTNTHILNNTNNNTNSNNTNGNNNNTTSININTTNSNSTNTTIANNNTTSISASTNVSNIPTLDTGQRRSKQLQRPLPLVSTQHSPKTPKLGTPRSPASPTTSASPSPTVTNPLLKEQVKLRWKRGKELGQGAYGTVWLGLNEGTGQLMAVKSLEFSLTDANIAQRLAALQQEIRMLKLLSHVNIVSYLCTERTGKTFNIFMEFVPGGSIASLLSQFGSLSEATCRNYTRQILYALEYLHQNNVVHRDVKGANVLVTVRGICKLADFGTAETIEGLAKPDKGGANPGTPEGTPAWMAPETVRGEKGGKQSDVWSLGATVLEMLTGEQPFAHISCVQLILLQKIGSDEVLPLPGLISSESAEFLSACLQKNPDLRASCSSLLSRQYCDGASDSDEESTSVGSGVTEDGFSPDPAVLHHKGVILGHRALSAMSGTSMTTVHSPQSHARYMPAGSAFRCPSGDFSLASASPVHSPFHASRGLPLIADDPLLLNDPDASVYQHSVQTFLDDSILEGPSPVSSRSRLSQANVVRKPKTLTKAPAELRTRVSAVSAASSSFTSKSRKARRDLSEGSRRIASRAGDKHIENVSVAEEQQRIARRLYDSCASRLDLVGIMPTFSDTSSGRESTVVATPDEGELVHNIQSSMRVAKDDFIISRVDQPRNSDVPSRTGSRHHVQMSPSARSFASSLTLPAPVFLKSRFGSLHTKLLIGGLTVAVAVLVAVLVVVKM
ncbi:Mitogen-activated protein kinase kinase kinase 2 [Diplonema papillatum]|nr:Mitogen-activated protein kinase kinase kinase 2 [Diplonema papillatum]